MENPIKVDDLGVPPFKETPINRDVAVIKYSFGFPWLRTSDVSMRALGGGNHQTNHCLHEMEEDVSSKQECDMFTFFSETLSMVKYSEFRDGAMSKGPTEGCS